MPLQYQRATCAVICNRYSQCQKDAKLLETSLAKPKVLLIRCFRKHDTYTLTNAGDSIFFHLQWRHLQNSHLDSKLSLGKVWREFNTWYCSFSRHRRWCSHQGSNTYNTGSRSLIHYWGSRLALAYTGLVLLSRCLCCRSSRGWWTGTCIICLLGHPVCGEGHGRSSSRGDDTSWYSQHSGARFGELGWGRHWFYRPIWYFHQWCLPTGCSLCKQSCFLSSYHF